MQFLSSSVRMLVNQLLAHRRNLNMLANLLLTLRGTL